MGAMCWVIGRGWEQVAQSRERAQWFLSRAAMCGKSVVLDADGLNLLALHEDWKRFIGENVIVTPHIGEMSACVEKVLVIFRIVWFRQHLIMQRKQKQSVF